MNTLSKKKARSGTSTVEAVIILPVLVLMTFGGLKYGLLFLRAQQITNVARQACRLAIRPYADNALVDNEIDRLMTAVGLEDYYTRTMPDVSSVGTGDELTLTVTLDTDCVELTLVNWLPLPENIVAQVSMSKEGP